MRFGTPVPAGAETARVCKNSGVSTWIVTGASRGLGRHLALQLAQRGARVLACARDEQGLAQLAIGVAGTGEIRPVPLDLSDPRQIDARLRAAMAGERDIAGVINNADIGFCKPFLEHTQEEFLHVLQVNLGAVMQVCHAVLPRLLKQGHGHIVNVGSDLGRRPTARRTWRPSTASPDSRSRCYAK